MLAPMARAMSATAPALEQSGGLVFKGIFLHPDHLVGFESSPATIEHETHNSEAALEAPYTSSSSSSNDSVVSLDYFSFRETSSSASSSSSPSSTASTPTMHSTPAFKPSHSFDIENVPLTSPAMLSFATFAPAGSQPASRAVSPKLGAPACRRVASSSMQRAVSSPVETQWALDRRRQAMCVATDLVNEQANRMARSKSVASPMLGLGMGPAPQQHAPSRGATTSRSRSGTSSPLITPFEQGWGSALPPRAPEPQRTVPFPYNVAYKPSSPARLARSHSVSHMGNGVAVTRSPPVSTTYQHHRKSLPGLYTSFASPPPPTSSSDTFTSTSASASGSNSASPVLTRPRRGTLTPLTPITSPTALHPILDDDAIAERSNPATAPLVGIIASELDVVAFEHDMADTPSSPPFKPHLHRGMTY
ncbi:hypothetical protein ACM66B_000526 [Microbotryomycetes sp. NB124-2]